MQPRHFSADIPDFNALKRDDTWRRPWSLVGVQGREIATLANGPATTGRHTANWSGRTQSAQAPRGLYFIRLTAAGRTFTKRFALLNN